VRIERRWITYLVLNACLALPPSATGQPVLTFDLDTGTPTLLRGQNTPFDQTAGGLTASFAGPTAAAFSVQSDASTAWRMSRFSGNYLYDNNVDRSVLSIRFSKPLAGISMTFATGDLQVEVPSDIRLTAYLDSNTQPAVGTAVTHGTYAGDTFPTGTLAFPSASRPFNLVEITVPAPSREATAFFLDNIVVTPYSAFASVSAASYVAGAPLARGSIASGFGQGLASGTGAAGVQPPPTILADTVVRIRDSAGAELLAPLYYVGPTQINYIVPDGTAVGAATVTVTSGGQATAATGVDIAAVAPGFFTANFDGKGVPAAWAITVAPDQTQTVQAVASCGATAGSCVTSPLDLGPSGTKVFLSLYGTGIRGRSSLAAVTATIGGVNATVDFASAQTQYAGLDQVNVLIPSTLAGRGEVDAVVTVDGRPANAVRVRIK
jgi:uncharacterized protein (TIGR03437 family)